VILKATKVEGVYDSDPLTNPKARRYRHLTYLDVLKKQLKVMDSTAISLCMDHRIPIVVFSLKKKGNVKKVVQGETIGTTVGDDHGGRKDFCRGHSQDGEKPFFT